MTETSPGWYADAEDDAQVRYWDGIAWTTQTMPASALGASVPATRGPDDPFAAPESGEARSASTGPRAARAGAAIVGAMALSAVGALGMALLANDGLVATDPNGATLVDLEELGPSDEERLASDARRDAQWLSVEVDTFRMENDGEFPDLHQVGDEVVIDDSWTYGLSEGVDLGGLDARDESYWCVWVVADGTEAGTYEHRFSWYGEGGTGPGDCS